MSERAITSFDKAFALLNHLNGLVSVLPDTITTSEATLRLSGEVECVSAEKEIVDRLKSKSTAIERLLSSRESENINSVISDYHSQHQTIEELLRDLKTSDSCEAPEKSIVQLGHVLQTHDKKPEKNFKRDEASASELETRPKSSFAADFQTALNSRLEEAEKQLKTNFSFEIKAAKEEAYSAGHKDGSEHAQIQLAALRNELANLSAELSKCQMTLKNAFSDRAIMEAKVTSVREESQRVKAYASKFGDSDPTEIEHERIALAAERDYYYKLTFRTVEEDLQALGTASAADHQRQLLQQLQQKQKDEAERIELQRNTELLEKKLATSCARIAVCESRANRFKNQYLSLRTILESQCTHTMELLDSARDDAFESSSPSRTRSLGPRKRGSSLSQSDILVSRLRDEISVFTSNPNVNPLQKKLASVLELWVSTFRTEDRKVKLIVETLAEIGTSSLAGPRRSVTGTVVSDVAVQASLPYSDAFAINSNSILNSIKLGLQHLHETSQKVENAQGRFLARLKPYILPSRVSRSVPKATVRSLMDPVTIASNPVMEDLVNPLQSAETSLLVCIHRLASLEVKPSTTSGSGGKDSPTKLHSPKSNKHAELEEGKGLTEAQRRRRWLMIKSTAMMEEAVTASQNGTGGHRGSISVPVGPQGKVAIVFTDIQSSTLLWQLYSDKMSVALKAHNQILRDAIVTFNGYEVKTIGDAFMIAFANPQDAVNYCMSIQDGLMKHTWDDVFNKAVEPTMTRVLEDSGEVPRFSLWNGLRVRVGIHLGEPLSEFDSVTKRTDYFGPMVNLSARVQGVALGGQTLISPQVLENINIDEIPIPCVVSSGGTHTLKGIDHPIKLFSIMPKHLARRDADFEEQVRQKIEKEKSFKPTDAPVDPNVERYIGQPKKITFVVIVCQRLPELSDEQWNFCLSMVFDSVRNTCDLCRGYISKQTSTVLQLAFESPTDAIRFSSQIQLSCLRLDYGDDIAELTDYVTTSPDGNSVVLYRGVNPKIGVHQCVAQGDIDVFSNKVVFQHCEGLAVVAALALNARLGEILVSDVIVPFVDERALKAVPLPSAVVVPDASPVPAHIIVPCELEERIQMRPEFATEDLQLDEDLDDGLDGPAEELFKQSDCLKCGKSIGPLCLKCVAIECKSCKKEFSVPKRCLGCSQAGTRRRRSSSSTPHQTPPSESILDVRFRTISANDLIAVAGRSNSSRSHSFSGSPKSKDFSPPPAVPAPLHPTFLSNSNSNNGLSIQGNNQGSSSSLKRTESGRLGRSIVGANSSTNLTGNLSITGTSGALGDGSIARSRLQNALRHRLGGAGGSAVSFASNASASNASLGGKGLSIDGSVAR